MNRPHAITFDPEQSMTKQSFKDECDINKIMDKFQRTGLINHYAAHAPTYGDASPVDYLEALQTIATAQEMFDELPSSVRKRFNNDPAQFLEFAENPKNIEQMREYGLAPPPLSDTQPDTPKPKRASAPTEPSEAPTPKDD